MRIAAIAGGWLWAAAIVWLSLTSSPPDPGISYGDKVGHFLAYGALMFWFCVLYWSGRTRAAYGILWIAMGFALEFAQGATGYRTFDLADMAANSLGVLIGWGLSATLRR
jgi:VanZ family protein